MYGGVQAAEGWGVLPNSRPQASKQLDWGSQQQWACRPQQQSACRPHQQLDCPLCSQPIPDEHPLTPDYESVCVAGYKANYDAACQTGSKATTKGRSTRSRCKRRRRTKGIIPTADGASPDWWEEDEHGDCDDGDKEKQEHNNNNKPLGIFKQRA